MRLPIACGLLLSLFAASESAGVPANAAGRSAALDSSRGRAILGFFQRWAGTPYVWGGTSRRGIDCSAYLRELYRELFAVELPRTTRQQIRLGVDLRIDAARLGAGLEPGDLVFFVDRTGVPNHVVVYAGGDRITHSVSGRGVVFESIDRVYGRRVVGRRLLFPSRDPGRAGGTRFGAIPAAPPVHDAVEIPCPPRFDPDRRAVRRWSRERLSDLRVLGEPNLCMVRKLAAALEAKGSDAARENARQLRIYADWLERLDAAGAQLFGAP